MRHCASNGKKHTIFRRGLNNIIGAAPNVLGFLSDAYIERTSRKQALKLTIHPPPLPIWELSATTFPADITLTSLFHMQRVGRDKYFAATFEGTKVVHFKEIFLLYSK